MFAALSLAVMSLSVFVPALANAAGNVTLTASSATGSKGSAVVVTISLDTAGSTVFGYQADLSYSAGYFSSASIAMAQGSPFTVDTGSNDPDIASNGNIHFTRFYTTAKVYSGPVATITLQSNGSVGTSAISFKPICASTASTANCSAVSDSGGTQLLQAINSGNINITEPVVSGGGAAASSKGAKKVAVASTTPAATTTPTPTTTKTTSSVTETVKLHKVTLTVLDQDGKPVKDTKVTLDGVTGRTDSNGKVTLGGLESGNAQGNVYYGDNVVPITVKIGSSDDIQSSKVNISIKKSSSTTPLAIGTIAFILAVAAFLLVMKGSIPKLRSQPKASSIATPVEPHAFTAVPAPEPPKPLPPAPKPPEPKPEAAPPEPPAPKHEEPKPVPKPESSPKPDPKSDEDAQLHEKAVDPGTIFTPDKE